MPLSQQTSTSNNSTPCGLSDQALEGWLSESLKNSHRVLYAFAGYLCKVVDLDDSSLILHPADPGSAAKRILKKLANKRLLFVHEMSLDKLSDLPVADNKWDLIQVLTASKVEELISTRDGILGRTNGRGPEINEKTAQKVWADAGARCMFEGCGADLSEISLWAKTARVGYLAHIVASDPEGPRGNQIDSHRLANNPDNIMLMCDEHHRLIDSFAPDFYTTEILNEMRQSHRDIVRNYLDSLAFPRTKAITLHANLANVPTYFHDSEFIEAILSTRRSMEPGVIHYVRRKSLRDDRHVPEFWYQYLREHENDIRQLVTGFQSANGLSTENLAVFPLHHIPTMVLAGRIIGEAQAVQIFQYDKERKTWAWNSQTAALPPGSFRVGTLSQERADEVLITLELTARIDEEALPTGLKSRLDSGELPWIQLTTSKTGFNCIGHQEDLEQFAQVARTAIVNVQDTMRVKRVHLICVSPASTVLRFGQMLQAGHHPEYIVYDRPSREYEFRPAFSITGHNVSSVDGHQSFTITLR